MEAVLRPIPEAERLAEQLRRRGIRDERVLEAIARTPRHLFVPDEWRAEAYDDNALPIGCEQTISQPYIVALMTEALALSGSERVLEIGTGSGYQAAILAQLCRELVTIERIPELSRRARRVLLDLGFQNIEFEVSNGTIGHPSGGPYDGIIITAAAPELPEILFEQLTPQGRMVVPVGDEQLQSLLLISSGPSGRVVTELCGCRFVKLIGQSGWPEES